MKFCPPICGLKLILPEPATMLGTNEAALALTALVLTVVLCFAVYRTLRPAR